MLYIVTSEFSQIYNNGNLLLGFLNKNSLCCLCFPAWVVSFQLFYVLFLRLPQRVCGEKEGLRKNQQWEIMVRITQQDDWTTFCPRFPWVELLQCLKLSTCLSVLLTWSQNTLTCIWLVPPELVQSPLERLENFLMPQCDKVPQASVTHSWDRSVQPQPLPSKQTDCIPSPGNQEMKS